MASTDSTEHVIERNRRTFYLLLGGAASLLIPLLGVLYIRLTESSALPGGATSHAFAHREAQADRIRAAATPAPPVPMAPAPGTAGGAPVQTTAGDSLGFVKGGSEYYPTEPATPVAAPQQTEAPPPVAKADPPQDDAAANKKPIKPGPKPFQQPKLQGSKFGGGFSNGFSGNKQFGVGGRNQPQGGMPQQGQQLPPGGMPDVSGMLKNISGAGGAAGAGKQQGMPDVGSMLQGITGGNADQTQKQK